MSFLDDFERHELYLQRIATALLTSKIYPSLAEAYKAARLILLDAESIKSPSELNKITAAVRKATEETTAAAWAEVTEELQSMGVYEAGFYAALVGGYADKRLKTPDDKQVKGFIDKSLMTLHSGAKVDSGFWGEYVSAQIMSVGNAYDSAVKAGYSNGETVSQIAGRIRMVSEGLLKNEAESLARTGVQHYATQARRAMAEANLDVIVREFPVVTFDNRTTPICMGIASKYPKGWPIGENPVGAPPYHYQCLSGDTNVTTCSAVSKIYKRWYEGRMVEITTETNRSIKITPNHPVLTARGWVKACDIDLTDKVVCIDDCSATRKYYKNSAVSKFSELFSSFDVMGKPSLVSVRPTSTKDFHGDTTDTYVNIVDVDSLGWDAFIKKTRNGIKNNRLPLRSLVEFPLKCFGSFLDRFRSSFASLAGFMASENKPCFLFRGCSSHSCKLLLASISKFAVNAFKVTDHGRLRAGKTKVNMDPMSTDPAIIGRPNIFLLFVCKFNLSKAFKRYTTFIDHVVDAPLGNAESLCNVEWRNTDGAKFESVINLCVTEFSGHVYNLENEESWYLSNGIITHNCRTALVHLVEGQDVPDGTRAAVGGQEDGGEAFKKKQNRTDKKFKYRGKKDQDVFKVGQIPAGTNIDTWLRSQPDWYIQSTLGATKAKLFKDGGMRLSKFTDATQRPLTIDELRELDSAAFKRAGL